ncbi:hypothetical protein [Acinetobacter bereziniae]|uniref:hypothetical protein n=1 Tax=Acinetobacter bereziniae TaxID=106648 RepID=UPI0025755A38|nr:hypothetical protein [Acinetobacter bereziniae]
MTLVGQVALIKQLSRRNPKFSKAIGRIQSQISWWYYFSNTTFSGFLGLKFYSSYGDLNMKKYGVEIIPRPAIKATKKLDLNGKVGEEIIKSLTEIILIRHQKVFKRLSEM